MKLVRNLILVICLIAAGIFAGSRYFSPQPGFMEVRSTRIEEMSPGCVLIAPLRALFYPHLHPENRPRVFLLNKRTKRVVHSWNTDFPVAAAKLDATGTLWALARVDWDLVIPTELLRLDKNSKLLTRIDPPNLWNDFELNPNLKSVFIFDHYEKKPNARGEKFIYNRVLEYELATKKIIWSWDTKDLNINENKLSERQIRSRRVPNVNAIRFVQTNPINQKPALLVNVRNNNEAILIDYETKKVIWRIAPGLMEYPHDTRLLENGDLLFFNNRRYSGYSTVDQIDIKRNELVWQYESAAQADLDSAIMGGAQRLPNGNTLVTNGMHGQIFEINPRKEVVWEYFQPFDNLPREYAWPIAPLFRVEQYDPDFMRQAGWGNACD